MKLYSATAIGSLVRDAIEKDCTVYTLEEGCLGYGLAVITGPGWQTAVVTEVPINGWSSGHKVRFYNRCPEKYRKMVFDKFGDDIA